MVVSTHDRAHRPARDRLENGFQMLGNFRAGINHHEFVGPQKIGLRALEREWRGIARKDPRNSVFQNFDLAVRCVHRIALARGWRRRQRRWRFTAGTSLLSSTAGPSVSSESGRDD